MLFCRAGSAPEVNNFVYDVQRISSDTVQFKELPSFWFGLVSYSHCDNQQCGKKLSTLPKNPAVWSPNKKLLTDLTQEWGFKGQYCRYVLYTHV